MNYRHAFHAGNFADVIKHIVLVRILISDDELKQRRAELKAKGGFPYPANQTPWQELYRSTVGQQATGACMELATRYHDIAGKVGVARDNH